MKKIIVTGGSGFIGSNLVRFLIKKKYFVINIDNLSYSSNKFDKHLNNNKNYKFLRFNINNKFKLIKTIKKYKPKAIFNLAAQTHVDRSIDSAKEFINSNILGVFNILEVLKNFKKRGKKIKLIHISTDEVYGDVINIKKRSSENAPYSPSSPYSATKAGADHLIKSYIRTYGIEAVISNCCNNYGPYQFPEKLIPKMIFNIIYNKELPLYNRGNNSREWIYVNDHCEALFKLYLKGKGGESYNIGTKENLTNIKLVKKILREMKKKKVKIGKKVRIKFVKDRPGHDMRYALNSNKIKKNLNWKPFYNFNTGLIKTINWYLDNPRFFKSFKKETFIDRMGTNR